MTGVCLLQTIYALMHQEILTVCLVCVASTEGKDFKLLHSRKATRNSVLYKIVLVNNKNKANDILE